MAMSHGQGGPGKIVYVGSQPGGMAMSSVGSGSGTLQGSGGQLIQQQQVPLSNLQMNNAGPNVLHQPNQSGTVQVRLQVRRLYIKLSKLKERSFCHFCKLIRVALKDYFCNWFLLLETKSRSRVYVNWDL